MRNHGGSLAGLFLIQRPGSAGVGIVFGPVTPVWPPARKRSEIPVWREKIFAFLSRNALGATAYYHIPPERVMEVGAQIEI